MHSFLGTPYIYHLSSCILQKLYSSPEWLRELGSLSPHSPYTEGQKLRSRCNRPRVLGLEHLCSSCLVGQRFHARRGKPSRARAIISMERNTHRAGMYVSMGEVGHCPCPISNAMRQTFCLGGKELNSDICCNMGKP